MLRPDGRVEESGHFGDRMLQAGFDMNDLRRLAQQGRIARPPVWDENHHAWTWRIEGHGLDGRWLGVVFTVLGSHQVKAVTVLQRGRRRP